MNGYRMDWRIVGIGIFAIAASCMMLALPVSGAVEVNVYLNDVKQGSPEIIDPQKHVSLQVTSSSPYSNVMVSVSGDYLTAAAIYRCKSMMPDACLASGAREDFASNVSRTYQWSELSGLGAYPQMGYLLILVTAVDQSGEKRIGYWYKLKKTATTFTATHYWISTVDLYTDSVDRVQDIKDFVRNRQAIPFNRGWVQRAVLRDAGGIDGFYQADTDNFTSFNSSYFPGSGLADPGSVYSMVFGKKANVFNPIVFYQNPGSLCGNGLCNEGEGPFSCCWDCRCPDEYYCSLSSPLEGDYCRSLGSISLKYMGAEPGMAVPSCNRENDIDVIVKIENRPQGLSILRQQYTIGQSTGNARCEYASGDLYRCRITVPADPDCQGGGQTISPNSLRLVLGFPDGPESRGQKEVDLTLSLPDISVGSWECGKSGCESQLGETCCYDCGCSSGVCDYVPGAGFGAAVCKAGVTSGDMYFSGLSSRSFYYYDSSGNRVGFELGVDTDISSFSSTQEWCSAACRRIPKDGSASSCESSCGLACTESASSQNGTYNLSCSLDFRITDYSEVDSYEITPMVAMSFSYNDGADTKTGTIEKSMPKITIGPNWCGNGDCAGRETRDDCCHDCPCQEGYYCHYEDGAQGCRPKSQIDVIVAELGSLEFSGTMPHKANYSVAVRNRPPELSLDASCQFNQSRSGTYCMIQCTELDSAGSDYRGYCEVSVPAMDYKSTPFYRASTQRIVITPVTLDFVLNYKDGARDGRISESYNSRDIVINVLSSCGDRWCSDDLGESAKTCCRDCFCEDSNDYGNGFFCRYDLGKPGSQDPGQCLKESDVRWVIDEVGEVSCEVHRFDSSCDSLRTVQMHTHIENLPGNAYVDPEFPASYLINGNQSRDISCFRDLNSSGGLNCTFILPPLGRFRVGVEDKALDFNVNLAYLSGTVIKRASLNASAKVGVSMNKSAVLWDLEHKARLLDRKTDRLKMLELVLTIILGVITAAFVTMVVLCAVGEGWACALTPLLVQMIACIGGLILAVIIPLLSAKIAAYEAKLEQLHAQMGTGEQEKIQQDIVGGIVAPSMSALLSVACLIRGMMKGTDATANTGAEVIKTQLQEMVDSIGKPIEAQWLETGTGAPESPLPIDRAYP